MLSGNEGSQKLPDDLKGTRQALFFLLKSKPPKTLESTKPARLPMAKHAYARRQTPDMTVVKWRTIMEADDFQFLD